MRAINDAFEGADAFRKMLEGVTEGHFTEGEPAPRYTTEGSRAQRRADERFIKAEKKRERKAGQRAELAQARATPS